MGLAAPFPWSHEPHFSKSRWASDLAIAGSSMSADCSSRRRSYQRSASGVDSGCRNSSESVRMRRRIIARVSALPNRCETQADRVASDDEAVGVETIVEVGVLGIPHAPAGQVEIPGQDRPLVRLAGVAVDVPVFAVHVDVADDRVGREHVDALRDVDVVAHVVVQGAGPVRSRPVDQRLQVGVVLALAVLLLDAAVRAVAGVLVRAGCSCRPCRVRRPC